MCAFLSIAINHYLKTPVSIMLKSVIPSKGRKNAILDLLGAYGSCYVLNIQVLQFLPQFQKRSRLENDQVSNICPLTTPFYHFINASCRNVLDTGQTNYRILSNYQFKSFLFVVGNR